MFNVDDHFAELHKDPLFMYWYNQPMHMCERCRVELFYINEVVETEHGYVCAECLGKAMMGQQNYQQCPVVPVCKNCLRTGSEWKK